MQNNIVWYLPYDKCEQTTLMDFDYSYYENMEYAMKITIYNARQVIHSVLSSRGL